MGVTFCSGIIPLYFLDGSRTQKTPTDECRSMRHTTKHSLLVCDLQLKRLWDCINVVFSHWQHGRHYQETSSYHCHLGNNASSDSCVNTFTKNCSFASEFRSFRFPRCVPPLRIVWHNDWRCGGRSRTRRRCSDDELLDCPLSSWSSFWLVPGH